MNNKKIKSISLFLILLTLFLLSSCSAKDLATEQPATFIDLSADAFKEKMTGEYLLLDVRTQEEYDEAHIEGATLIPLDVLEKRIEEISEYKDTTVLVYCRSGNRSVVASNILLKNGFTKVYNLDEGINSWNY